MGRSIRGGSPKTRTATPTKKKQAKLAIKPTTPGTYRVITAERITAIGRKAPNSVALSRSSGYHIPPRFFLDRIMTISDIHPDRGAPTENDVSYGCKVFGV